MVAAKHDHPALNPLEDSQEVYQADAVSVGDALTGEQLKAAEDQLEARKVFAKHNRASWMDVAHAEARKNDLLWEHSSLQDVGGGAPPTGAWEQRLVAILDQRLPPNFQQEWQEVKQKGDILATKVDTLATKGDILATKVDNLATKGDILATKVDNLPTKLGAMMWNNDSSGINRRATSDTDNILPLKNDSGGRPAHFPTTLGEFNRLNNDQITPFLEFYGLDRSRSRGSKLNRLKNHICGHGE